MRRVLAILAFVMLSGVAPAKAGVEAVLTNTLNAYVRPSYIALHEATRKWETAAQALCRSPSVEAVDGTQAAFKDTVLAWSKIEWFRSGSVMNENRIERIFFFPDRKSTGLKQVQAALASKDSGAINLSSLSAKSVAMQGLGASEFLLFGNGSEALASADGAYRCSYILASAQTILSIAAELETGWANTAEASHFWQEPSAGNPFFRSDVEALNMLIGTLIHGLEAVKDARFAAFLGKTPETDKPKLAAYWRSETTFQSIAANLEGLKNFYEGSNLQSVLPSGNDGLLRTINFDFSQAIRAAKALEMPVADVLNNADLRKKAVYAQLTLQIMIEHFNTEFAVAAGLDAGFSFGDGD